MELENPTGAPTTITDEQRLLAQTKKVTIQPANPFLKREDAPDPITVNETHSNISRDAENTSEESSLIQPSAGIMRQAATATKHHSYTIALISVSIILGVAAGAAIFFFVTSQ